jgi:sterol desaturase/sphingolipid hydroxylase (fatty acid hydroxylase superfamily)
VLSAAIYLIVQDTHYYWMHRLMHHPKLFRLFHRTHHLSTNPSPWAAYAFSPLEAFVQAGIAPLVLFTLPIHPLAFSIFMLWQIGFNVLGHCGYELFPRWFVRSPLGRVLNTATHHAQHHETNRANFSLYFNHWDHLMGTNHARYAERFEEAVGKAP